MKYENSEILEQIGMSKNEIKVYFALLELDQSSATPIVKKAGIPNSKVYPTLEKLISKGLVSYVIKNNVKYFQASNPKNLVEYVEKKENQLSEQKRLLKNLVLEIKERKKSVEKQESYIYEDFNGVKAAFNEILNELKKGDEYFVFTLGNELDKEELKLFFSNYHQKRIKKGIKVKLIANNNIKNIVLKYHKFKDMKIKFTDLKLPAGIFIFSDYVMTITWKNKPTAFVIKSKSNAEQYKQFFEEMWKIA